MKLIDMISTCASEIKIEIYNVNEKRWIRDQSIETVKKDEVLRKKKIAYWQIGLNGELMVSIQ